MISQLQPASQPATIQWEELANFGKLFEKKKDQAFIEAIIRNRQAKPASN